MNKYKALIVNNYKRKMEQRMNMLFANFQSIFTLFILFYFWQSIYGTREVLNGYTFPQIITYYFLIRITYNRVSAFGAASLAKDIKNGDITADLLKPINYINLFITRNYIGALIWTIGNLVAVLTFSFFLFNTLVLPPTLANLLAFLVVFFINGFLANLINIIIGTLGFWSTEVTHLKLVTTSLVSILSGGLIPLSFFPEKMQKILDLLPFKYLIEYPINIYLGKEPLSSIPINIVILFSWVSLFYLVANFIFKKGLKTYESYN